MEIIKIPVGYLEANCYIVFDDKTKDAIIIDPGDDAEKILSEIDRKKLKPLSIINTHNHFDHTGANEVIKQKLNIKIYYPKKDNEEKKFGTLRLKFLFTPGHTNDGICILAENYLFSGDTIFAGSVGRCDMEDGNGENLISSIKNKILPLPKSTIIYPGHGSDTTLENEIKYNPFLS